MNIYNVKKFTRNDSVIEVSVPASKSILNRALVLSAFSEGKIKLVCGSFAQDTRVLFGCLASLGIRTETDAESVTVYGCGGKIPVRQSNLYVGSAGTAARFLTVMLAFCGGEYYFTSSEQMEKRPMDVLHLLEGYGVEFEFSGEPYHFPFFMKSKGIEADEMTVDTDKSTQYASGILLAAAIGKKPFSLTLTGTRTQGSYIGLTLDLLNSFGVKTEQTSNSVKVYPAPPFLSSYTVEPDLSGACYFYALALLLQTKVLVRRVHENSRQGDARFLQLLKEKGVQFTPQKNGLLADGSNVANYTGFDVDMEDFSDQTLTVAVLAAFAATPSRLFGIGHIRLQECDRIAAVCNNLTALGVPASFDGKNLSISPAPVRGGTVKTYEDHRVAMAFALMGLKTGNIGIENPDCCKKTFENYFEIITELTKQA